MRDFIKNGLKNAINEKQSVFYYQYTRADNNTITMSGKFKNGIANFVIERIKANGHRCSSIPVIDAKLTDKSIEYIAELAAEVL